MKIQHFIEILYQLDPEAEIIESGSVLGDRGNHIPFVANEVLCIQATPGFYELKWVNRHFGVTLSNYLKNMLQ